MHICEMKTTVASSGFLCFIETYLTRMTSQSEAVLDEALPSNISGIVNTNSGSLFTKRTDVLPQDFVKSRSCGIRF